MTSTLPSTNGVTETCCGWIFNSSALMPSFASMPFSTWLAPVNQVVTVLPLKSCSGLYRSVLAGDEDERRDLMRNADADDRQALVARCEHAVGTAGQAERIGAGRDQIFSQQVGAAGIDGEIDALGLVVAFCQRDVEAGELRLRQPFQPKARLGEGVGRGGSRYRHGGRPSARRLQGRRGRGVGSASAVMHDQAPGRRYEDQLR